MNFLAALASIIPQIAQAIAVAESLFPAAGSGDSKLAHVIARAKEIVAGAPLRIEHASLLLGAVEPAVKGIVSVLNDTGLFKHGGYVPDPTYVEEPNETLADELQGTLEAAGKGAASILVPASLLTAAINALRETSPENRPGGATDASGAPVVSSPGG